jgi:hypothetical protein
VHLDAGRQVLAQQADADLSDREGIGGVAAKYSTIR